MVLCWLVCELNQSYTALSTSLQLQLRIFFGRRWSFLQCRKKILFVFHRHWNSILWHFIFFRGLLVCHIFLDMADDFTVKDLFLSFLFTADISFNHHWIKTKFLECCLLEKRFNFFIWTMRPEFELLWNCYSSKSPGCFTFWNSYSKSPWCSN